MAMPHSFAQSTHVSWAQAYKAHVGGVSPRYGIEQTTTHVSWAQAYKAHVRGVSPRCGIKQIREALAKADNTC